jgi:hypothetical protein
VAEEPKTHGWWQTLPGILTTIVGIITGLTGLIVALQQAGVFQKKPEPVSIAQDLCRELDGFSIHFDINKHAGVIGPAGIALQQTGKSVFRFETILVFNEETNRRFSREIKDPIGGTCQGNTIHFTRKLWDGTAQIYNGEISKTPSGVIIIKGSFDDQDNRSYEWSGKVAHPIPN